ncbi:hypothetical protein GM658_00640 [Pseudoduganella eburnea]|uniref:Uncharacterized protein n=1 Tax=Massilia eburnea TaxID=1776165 RepID=A0A6L6QA52_9BURK|nr:hypothetical protein [Massilia eburnea]MTW09095.1 hypothetical protein [Massilia eburnea]
MQKLNVELKRLYLAAADGGTRSIALVFKKMPGDGDAGHWDRLCSLANTLQSELGLPAPAVSISGADSYALWLSLAQPVSQAQAQAFVELLSHAYCPELSAAPSAIGLPPYLNQGSGKWAAFIHPGMGASFAGDEGLEIQPPEAGQVALLEGLESIPPAQFMQALDQLRLVAGATAPQAAAPVPAAAEGLLLKDATLEDIVKHLHAMNIEPTFRFLK